MFNYLFKKVVDLLCMFEIFTDFFYLLIISSFSSFIFCCRCKEGYRGLRCDQFVPKTDPILSNPSMFYPTYSFFFLQNIWGKFEFILHTRQLWQDLIPHYQAKIQSMPFSPLKCLCQWWNKTFLWTLKKSMHHIIRFNLLSYFLSLRKLLSLKSFSVRLKMPLFCKT